MTRSAPGPTDRCPVVENRRSSFCHSVHAETTIIGVILYLSTEANTSKNQQFNCTKTSIISMGSSESTLSSSPRPEEGITTVSERSEAFDPILERLRSLKITTPILTSQPTDGSLTDILVRNPSSSSTSGTVNPNVLLELFSMYRDWQEEKAQKISKKQEEMENKIEVADALAVKLLQRLNYSVSAMKTTSHHLSEVHALKVEVGGLKGRLTEVISNCDALCKRITAEGPDSLRSSIKPFAMRPITSDDLECSSLQPVSSEARSSDRPS